MSKVGAIRVAALCALLAIAPVCGAGEVELAAATKTATQDANVMTYSGDVTLKVPAGTNVQLKGRAMKRERGMEILRGEVEIKLDKMILRTEQASVTRNEQFTLVKMDTAQVTTISP